MTQHTSLNEIYLKFPEHFASGVQAVAKNEAYPKIAEVHPEFTEHFPSGRKSKAKTQELPMQMLLAQYQMNR
ncbi:MAG: hypothetical protein IJY92_00815 [Alphaproteobacteria bacterium]|nr:hypothetical protein [Alphaproteobacteria bacterium]